MTTKIRELRIRSGMTMAELARRASVSTKFLQRLERGEGSHREENLWKVYNALRRSEEVDGLPPFEELFG